MVSGVAGFFIAVLVVAFAVLVLYVGYTQVRARKLGLPPPSISSYNPFQFNNIDPYATGGGGGGGGILGWFKQRINAFKNRNNRSATGGYEGARHIDDEAWDAQADYGYEAELDDPRLQQNTSYNTHNPTVIGSSYNMNLAQTPAASQSNLDPDVDEPRGRSRSREPGPEVSRANPFGDDAPPSNMSTTSLGPYGQPMQGQTSYQAPSVAPERPANASPERRSIFREEV